MCYHLFPAHLYSSHKGNKHFSIKYTCSSTQKRVNCRSCWWSRYLCKKKKNQTTITCIFIRFEEIFQKYSSKICISKIAIDRIIFRKNVEGVQGYRWWNARLSSALYSGLVDYRKYLVEKWVFRMGLPAPQTFISIKQPHDNRRFTLPVYTDSFSVLNFASSRVVQEIPFRFLATVVTSNLYLSIKIQR